MLRRGAKRPLHMLILTSLLLQTSPALASSAGNQLSKRAELRYQDVLTTRNGSRWRGKVIERGEVFRIRLDDNSEIVILKADVASVTRELHPSFPHTGQWDARAAVGIEVGIVASDVNAGAQYGPLVELAVGYNFGGPFEPELVLALSPIGPDDDAVTAQLALGLRYYLQAFKKAKPFTSTHIVVAGAQGDIGLRSGPGFLFDVSPNFGFGVSQGVSLLSQAVKGAGRDGGDYEATAVGFYALMQAQGRF